MSIAPKTQRRRERTLLLLGLGLFAVVVINLNLFSFRLDLTSGGAWSISPATKAVVANAKDEISVTYYLSKKLTTYYPFTLAISDFLEEYAAASGGKVRVKIVDPKDSGELNDMARYGLQPIPIQVVEQSQQTQAVVYSGLVLQYQERREVLPAVSQVETLEYDLTTKVNKLVTQKQKTVAILTMDPTKTFQNYYSILVQSLSPTATVRQVQKEEEIGDATVLIVAGSEGFTQASLKPIDDYLMKGGKVLFAVDGVFVDISRDQAPAVAAGPDNDLLKALETWGVKVEQGLLHDAYNTIVQFQGGQGVTLRRYPLWPAILAKNTSTTNPVTSRFSGLTLMWASPLVDLKKAGIKVEPLAWTSEKSWLMRENMNIDPDQAARSGSLPGVEFKKYDVAMALTGSFPSAVTSGVVSPTSRILVVGSSNFLSNLMQVTGNEENAAFVEGAVDWLAQDEGMLSIKTRTYRDKSLTMLQNDQDRKYAEFILSFINLFLIPLAIVVWAVVRFLRRRSREQKT